jgi:hypothetical protein
MAQRARLQRRSRKITQVLDALRASIPADDFDKNDWDALRVAIRIVYETEELRVALRRKRSPERTSAVSYWLDSIESGITFMSWTRELADMVTGTTYPNHFPAETSKLWLRHSSLARRLLAVKVTPSERLSVLIELGGLELALAGRFWALRPVYSRAVVAEVARILGPGRAKLLRQQRGRARTERPS